jgi:signal transduction histidine kinase
MSKLSSQPGSSVSNKGLSLSYKIFLALGFIAVGLVFFYYTQDVVNRLKDDSKQVVTTYAKLWQLVASGSGGGDEISILFEEVIQRSNFPIVITDPEGNPIAWRQINDVPEGDTTRSGREKVLETIKKMDRSKEPISIYYEANGEKRVINLLHYGDPHWVARLHFIPLIEIGIMTLFVVIGFLGLLNVKRSEQQSIWVGMAKETAHQLGTPISSLMGWIEILRSQSEAKTSAGSPHVASEMEKDVQRLEKIASRFGQIGSEPEFGMVDIVSLSREVVEYYRQRLPYSGTGVKIEENYRDGLQVSGNRELLSWVLENVIKNSLEAVDPKNGRIEVLAQLDGRKKCVVISVTDNGKGIPAKDQKNIFSPGFTTKKRGWGLGLSLAKRIVEQYHKGKIYLAESVPGVRTEIRIQMPFRA